MHLNIFIEKEKKQLEAFLSYWYENHKLAPDTFPLEMEHGDWLEHLATFDPDNLLSPEGDASTE